MSANSNEPPIMPQPENDSNAVTVSGQTVEVEVMPVKRGRGGNYGGHRPSSFTQAKGQEFTDRYAAGETWKSICMDDHMPDENTINRWLKHADFANASDELKAFASDYEAAQLKHADALVRQATEIADDGSNDFVQKLTDKGLAVVYRPEHVARSKMRVDVRLRIAAMYNPKKYAPLQKHADADGNKLPSVELNSDVSARRIALILETAAKKA